MVARVPVPLTDILREHDHLPTPRATLKDSAGESDSFRAIASRKPQATAGCAGSCSPRRCKRAKCDIQVVPRGTPFT